MSWKDNIEVELVIQTGDEKEYRPKGWLNAAFDKDFNISKFEFPDVDGTYIRKTRPKGRIFTFEIYFQGDDHLVESNAFDVSSNDERHWHVIHPYYGNIRVQPGKLRFDNSNENLTKITGPLFETILGDLPRGNDSFKDIIAARKELSDFDFAGAYENNIPQPTPDDEIRLTTDFQVLTKDVTKLIITVEETNKFNELFSKANSAITNFTAEPLAAMLGVQTVLNFPIALDQSIDARLNLLITQFESTLNTVLNFPLEGLILSQKAYFETIAGTLIGAIALIVSNNQSADDYGSQSNVISIIDRIILVNNQYVDTLDLIQSGNGTQTDSFIPSVDPLVQITSLINFTITNLFQIAFSARQEREVILEEDSNLIVLSHRFYGPDSTDQNLEELIRNNNYGIKQHLLVKKGTLVKYFVE